MEAISIRYCTGYADITEVGQFGNVAHLQITGPQPGPCIRTTARPPEAAHRQFNGNYQAWLQSLTTVKAVSVEPIPYCWRHDEDHRFCSGHAGLAQICNV